MVAKVDIFNMAISKVAAAARLSDPESSDDKAQECRVHWDNVRDRVMRSHPWNSIMRHARLTQNGRPHAHYGFVYNFPNDPWALKIDRLESDTPIKFEIQGRTIVTDAAGPLIVRYHARIDDTEQWDPGMVEGIALLLASRIAYKITKSATMGERLLEEYEKYIKESRTDDAQEGSPEEVTQDEALVVRGW